MPPCRVWFDRFGSNRCETGDEHGTGGLTTGGLRTFTETAQCNAPASLRSLAEVVTGVGGGQWY